MKRILTFIFIIFFFHLLSHAQQLTLQNPSFEANSSLNGAPSGWATCGTCCASTSCTVSPLVETLENNNGGPSDGNTFVQLNVSNIGSEAISQKLCSPILKGVTYSFTIDVRHFGANGNIEIWGSYDCCRWTEKLWSTLVTTTYWQTKTVTINSPKDFTHILIKGSGVSGSQTPQLCIDNITGTTTTGCAGLNSCSGVIKSVDQCQPYCITPTVSIIPNTASICPGDSIQLTAGSPAMRYFWSTGATTSSIYVRPSSTTTYTLAADNGYASCSATKEVTILVNIPNVSITKSSISVCLGQENVLTGNGADTYTWTAGPASNTYTVSPPVNSTYTVTGTVTHTGCTASATATVFVNAWPTLAVGTSGASVCNGNTITMTASGAITYSWKGGTTPSSGPIVNANPPTSTQYTVIGTSNQCNDTAFVDITIYPQPSANINIIHHVYCTGHSSGCAEVVVNSGTPAYLYNWSNGVTESSNCSLIAGNYTVTIHDKNNCSASATVQITQPNATLVTGIASQTNVKCNGQNSGCVSISASGGTTPYAYSWSNNAQVQSICNVSAGNYTVTVTDANSCTALQLITISEPSPLHAGIDTSLTKNATCFNSGDGSLTATASGGTPSYTYNWTGGPQQSTFPNLPAGNYTVTVTDAHSCSVVVSANGGATITQPPLIKVTITSSAPTTICSGKSTTLTAVISNANNYVWSNGATTSVITVSPTATKEYSITATNANGCTGTEFVIITVNPLPSLKISDIDIDTALCNFDVGKIYGVVVSSGTPTYTYQWKNINTGKIVGDKIDLSNVGPGDYRLIVTDSQGCIDSTYAPINIPFTPKIIASFTATPISGEKPLVVHFTNTTVSMDSCWWNFSNDSSSTATHPSTTYLSQGKYMVTLIVKSPGGCMDTTRMFINVKASSFVNDRVNVFTPNGDGINDVFRPITHNLAKLHCEIMDRWGVPMYTWDTVEGGWDGYTAGGLPAPAGTYYYVFYGIGLDNEAYKQTGYLLLIR